MRVSLRCEPLNSRSSRNTIHLGSKGRPPENTRCISDFPSPTPWHWRPVPWPSHQSRWALARRSRSSRQSSPPMPSHGRSRSCPTTASSSTREKVTCASSTRLPRPQAPSLVCPPSPTAARAVFTTSRCTPNTPRTALYISATRRAALAAQAAQSRGPSSR